MTLDSRSSAGVSPGQSPGSRHIVITGASSGIGRALALHYAAPGVTLSLTGRDAGRLGETLQGCAARGAIVASALIDVREAEALARWLLERDEAEPVGTLIAAAGIGGADAVPTDSGETGPQALAIFGVNTLGVVNTVTPLLPRMTARGRGQIAIVGSIAGLLGLPQTPAYCASKAAVDVYADGLRRLLAPKGVRVTAVLPGFVDTPMSRSLEIARPFCWSAEKAAVRIARAIDAGKGRFVFPWPLRAAIGLARLVPSPILDVILTRANSVVTPKRNG